MYIIVWSVVYRVYRRALAKESRDTDRAPVGTETHFSCYVEWNPLYVDGSFLIKELSIGLGSLCLLLILDLGEGVEGHRQGKGRNLQIHMYIYIYIHN